MEAIFEIIHQLITVEITVDTLMVLTVSIFLLGITLILYYTIFSYQVQIRDTEGIINKILDYVCLRVELTHGIIIRGSVFLPTSRKSEFLGIKFNSTRLTDSSYLKLRLGKDQGVVGNAWGMNSIVIADLGATKLEAMSAWGLTVDQMNLMKQLKAIFSLPLIDHKSEETIGVLTFDSETATAIDLFMSDDFQMLAIQIGEMINALFSESNFRIPVKPTIKTDEKITIPSNINIPLKGYKIDYNYLVNIVDSLTNLVSPQELEILSRTVDSVAAHNSM